MNFDNGTPARSGTRAFTLVELVLAIALLSGAFLTMLLLRTDAVERAYKYNRARLVQRLAQEKLDELVGGIGEETQGTFPERPEWHWAVTAVLISNEGPDLLECTMQVTMPNEAQTADETYRLSTWFLPEKEHPLINLTRSSGTATDGVVK